VVVPLQNVVVRVYVKTKNVPTLFADSFIFRYAKKNVFKAQTNFI